MTNPLQRKTHRFRPTQVAFMEAAKDVNWSLVMRTACDLKIHELVAIQEIQNCKRKGK